MLRRDLDPLGLEAVHAYFCELYFRARYDALDAAKLGDETFPIMPALDAGAGAMSFPFSRVARAFKLIDETMEPILIPWDAAAETALEALEHAELPPGGVLRTLQQYVVPVPAKVRRDLLARGGAVAIKGAAYGDRFVRLHDLAQYDPVRGLRIDDLDWRSAESNVL